MNLNQAIEQDIKLTRRITVEFDQYAPGDSRRFRSYVVRKEGGLYYVNVGRGQCRYYVTGFKVFDHIDFETFVFSITSRYEFQQGGNS
jgi:hypothetical protein